MKLYLDRSKCTFSESLNGRYIEVDTGERVAVETAGGDFWLEEDVEHPGAALTEDATMEL